MRWGAYIIISTLVAAGGCAMHPKAAAKTSVQAAVEQPAVPARYQPAVAGALVFDPPVIAGQPPLQLSREGRGTDAFMGYEAITTTYFYLRTDDRQTSDRNDRYERRAISTKVGVSYR